MTMNTVLRKELFNLPDGVIYLDGNSLGPLPASALARATKTIGEEWGQELIRAWNSAGWMSLPQRVGDKIAQLIGAPAGSVTTGDTLSIKVYQAVAAALKMRPDRKVILSDNGNFPSDLYMVGGLIDTISSGHRLLTPSPDQVADHIDETVAVVMLTQVDYRTGRLHDMHAITRKAQEAGAVVIWDLAHSAGAVPLDLTGCGAEFAVGCSYKYLNGGPGAPAFIYVRPDVIESIEPALAGWMGHDAPFGMELAYRPAMSIERLRVGTPAIVQLSILDEALEVWNGVEMSDIRKASITLSEMFIAGVESRCPGLKLASPRQSDIRGSQVSFAFEHGYAAIQALIDHGVIGDFRAPDIMRFGFCPLYIGEDDVTNAVEIVAKVINDGLWDDPKYKKKLAVT
ncbi:kynureninase [Agrobacterium sp. BA1120]|uniref:kynureninase n=1 Tax=Agrobacterium sp. BA1120 TaxID=3228927 RepID=UPI00336ABEDF